MPIGRPTDYKPEYCDMIIDHMSTGKSLTSFAASIDTHRAVVYDWAKANKPFHDAMKKAQAKCQAYWESQGQAGVWNKDGEAKINPAIWIFTMKSRFGMSDQPKQEIPDEDLEPEYGDLLGKSESEK